MKRIIAIILAIVLLLNVFLITACSDIEKTYSSLYDYSNVEKLKEEGIIDSYSAVEATKPMTGKEVVRVLNKYFAADIFTGAFSEEENVTEEELLQFFSVFLFNDKQDISVDTANAKSQNDNRKISAIMGKSSGANELTLISLSDILAKFSTNLSTETRETLGGVEVSSYLVRGSTTSLRNGIITGNLYIVSSQTVELQNLKVQGEIIVVGVENNIEFNQVNDTSIYVTSLAENGMLLEFINSNNLNIETKTSTEVRTFESSNINVKINGLNARSILNGNFNSVETMIDSWSEISGNVDTLTISSNQTQLVLNKESVINNLNVNMVGKIYNNGEILTGYMNSVGTYFTKLPKDMVGDKEIVDTYKKRKTSGGGKTTTTTVTPDPVDYPKITLSANYDKKTIAYADIDGNTILDVEVSSESAVSTIEIIVTNLGVTTYNQTFYDMSNITIEDLTYKAGTNILTIIATNKTGKRDIVIVKVNREETTTFLSAPSLMIDTTSNIELRWNEIQVENIVPLSEVVENNPEETPTEVKVPEEVVEVGVTYNVYRSEIIGKYEKIATGLTSLSFVDTTAVFGTSYTYVVQAEYENTLSAYSNEGKYTAPAKAPKVIATVKGGVATLNWNKSNGSSSFEVYKVDGLGAETLIVDKLLKTTYSENIDETTMFKIKALNQNGEGNYSEIIVVNKDEETESQLIFNPDMDSDGDGLTDEEELLYGTDPKIADTDKDGLSDYEEILMGTNPLVADTDGDGIFDGAEVLNGTDPLTKTIETKEVTKSAVSTEGTAQVEIKGSDNLSLATLIATENRNEYFDFIDGIIGSPVTFTSGGYTFEEATLSFKYTDQQLEEQGLTVDDLSIIYVNEATQRLEALDSVVDTENKTVTAKTTHFSTYLLGNKNIQMQLENMEVVFVVERDYSYQRWVSTSRYKCGGHTELYCPGHFEMVRNPNGGKFPIPKISFHNNGCQTRIVACPGLNVCDNKILVRSGYYTTQRYATGTKSQEQQIIDRFTSNVSDTNIKIGIADNATSSNNLAVTTNINEINTALGNTRGYYGTTPSKGLNGVENLFSEGATNKVVNYIRVYSNPSSLQNQAMTLYKNNGIKTNIISLYASETDSNFASLKQAADFGKGAYFGIKYNSGTDKVNEAIDLMYTKLAKVWTFEEYITEDAPQDKINLTFSDLYAGVEGEEVTDWITTASTNLLTGNYMHQVTDISYAQDSLPLGFTRTYSSLNPNVESIVGVGNVTNFDSSIKALDSSTAIVAIENVNGYKDQDKQEVAKALTKGTKLEVVSTTDNMSKVKMDEEEFYVETDKLYVGEAYQVTLPTGGKITFVYKEGRWLPLSKMKAELFVQDGVYRYEDNKGIIYEYNKTSGQLVNVQDENGNFITLEWSGKYLTVARDTYGRGLYFSYNRNGLLQGITDDGNRTVKYSYNNKNQLVSVTDLNGTRNYYTYNPFTGILESVLDENKKSAMTNSYDLLGRIVRQYDGENNVKYFIYDDVVTRDGEIGTSARYVVDELGVDSRIVYNFEMKPIEMRDTYGGVMSYEYYYYNGQEYVNITDIKRDSQEHKTYMEYVEANFENVQTKEIVIDKEGNRVESVKDGKGNVIMTVDAMGNVQTMEYDNYDNLIKRTDPLGAVETFTYDENGILLISSVDKLGRLKTIEYYVPEDGFAVINRIKSETDFAGSVTKYYYEDEYKNLTKVENALGYIKELEYDILGRNIATVNEEGARTSIKYDNMSRTISTTNPNGDVKTYKYDSKNNILSETDELGIKTTYTYYKNGRLQSKNNPNGFKVTYKYDNAGNIIEKSNSMGSKVIYTYNDLGQMLTEENLLGAKTTYTYDKNGNVTSKTDENGNEYSYEYNANGAVIKEIDPEGNFMEYEYDALGRKTATVYKDRLREETEYDPLSRVIKQTQRNGGAVTTSYNDQELTKTTTMVNGGVVTSKMDRLGKVIEITDPLGYVTQYEYDKVGNVVKETAPNGLVKENKYDNLGNLIEAAITGEKTEIVTFEYDIKGRVISKTNNRGGKEETTYDNMGQVIEIRNSDGTVQKNQYNLDGTIKNQTSPAGGKTSYKYDKYGNVTEMTLPSGGVAKKEYTTKGQLQKETDPNGGEVSYEYDSMGRITSSTDQLGNITTLEYDVMGQNTKTTVGGFSTVFVYDSMGKVVSQTNPDGGMIQREYDLSGNETQTVDAMGNITKYEYDLAGRVTKLTDAKGTETTNQYDSSNNLIKQTTLEETKEYSYNMFGDLTSVKVGETETSYKFDKGLIVEENYMNLLKTLYEYDDFGKVTSKTFPDGTKESYIYNQKGQLVERVLKDGQKITYKYDTMGNIVEENEIVYTFDQSGNMVKVVDGTKEINVVYNVKNLIESIDYGNEYVIEYKYNELGLKSKVQLLGQQILYTYDNMGRIKTVSSNGVEASYTYDKNGNATKVQLGDNVYSQYQFDSLNLPTEILNVNGSNREVNTYEYDSYMRQTKKTENGKVTEYRYDQLGRLINVLEEEQETIFTYTNLSNRESKEVTSNGEVIEKEQYLYDSVGRLTSITDTNGATTKYSYDQRGNTVAVENKNGTIEYKYDIKNQLTFSKTASGVASSYGYYFNGLRSENSNTSYLYDGVQTIAEVNGETVKLNVYGNNLLFSVVVAEENTSLLYQYNGHGDVIKVLNEEGVMLNSYLYDAFGNIVEQIEAVSNNFMYSGYIYDEETGLYYLRSRYYDSKTARFLTEDSFNGWYEDPLSLNKYTYVHNNPVNYDDPTGMFFNFIAGAIGAVVGGAISAGIELGTQLASGKGVNWKAVGASAAEGAIVGGVAGLTMGNPVAVGLAASAGNAIKQGINKGFDKIDIVEVLVSGATGAIGAGTAKIAPKLAPALTKVFKSPTVGRMVTSAVGDMLGDAAGQAIAIKAGLQDEFSLGQTLFAGVTGSISEMSGSSKPKSKGANNVEINNNVVDNGIPTTKRVDIDSKAGKNAVNTPDVGANAKTKNKTPNPYGRKGGPEHQAVIDSEIAKYKKMGYGVDKEFYMKTAGGQKRGRFADVAILDSNDDPIKFIQVGRQTTKGLPVSRERQAIFDILNFSDYSNVPIEFIPYK